MHFYVASNAYPEQPQQAIILDCWTTFNSKSCEGNNQSLISLYKHVPNLHESNVCQPQQTAFIHSSNTHGNAHPDCRGHVSKGGCQRRFRTCATIPFFFICIRHFNSVLRLADRRNKRGIYSSCIADAKTETAVNGGNSREIIFRRRRQIRPHPGGRKPPRDF